MPQPLQTAVAGATGSSSPTASTAKPAAAPSPDVMVRGADVTLGGLLPKEKP